MNELMDYLKSQNVMSLATCSEDVWICNVFYVVDDSLNLYFISDPNTKHVTDIKTNNNIACSITDSSQLPGQSVEGIQLQGKVEEIKGIETIKWFFEMWKKLNPNEKKLIWSSFQKKMILSEVYKIRPSLIKYMNKKLFGQEGYKVYILN
jgi:uncharacterized protein YhbP (UPF0306 family)